MIRTYLSMALLAALVLPAGCSSESRPDAEAPPAAGVEQADAHREGGEEHEHNGHTHGAAPHGGTIADWGGGDYHVEFTVDHDKQQATVYVLGEDAQSPAPVATGGDRILLTLDQPALQIELAADPQEGDPEGTSSRYIGQHEQLGTVQQFSGIISAEVDGTPYAAEFSEAAHRH